MNRLNPVFSGIKANEGIESAASVGGVSKKTALLLGIAILSAVLSIFNLGAFVENIGLYILVIMGAFICGLVGQMSVKAAPVCSIIYSVCEGTLLGIMSLLFETIYPGIVLPAVLVTFTIFGVMLLLYSTKIIKVTNKFVKFMSAVGISILVISVIYTIAYLINPNNFLTSALINNTGLLILTSVIVLLYGAFMLVLDFEQVNSLVSNGFDKRYEWTAALGLMVTIVWIYVEVLRLLAIIASRRD